MVPITLRVPNVKAMLTTVSVRLLSMISCHRLCGAVLWEIPENWRLESPYLKMSNGYAGNLSGVHLQKTIYTTRIPKQFGNPIHSVCAAEVASHLFLDGAATPPGGELPASHSFHRLPLQSISVFCNTLPTSKMLDIPNMRTV